MKVALALISALALMGTALGGEIPRERSIGSMEIVATFDTQMPTGVTVGDDHRVFVSFPRWGDPVEYTVAEIKGGIAVPYPNAEINRPDEDRPADHLMSVQSVVIDPGGKRLWLLDAGSVSFRPLRFGGPKLIAVDLDQNKITNKILFSPEVALPGTYLNDVRFDLHRGKEGMAFITDSANDGPNGIIVVDLASGKSWRRLNGHRSVQADPDLLHVVEGEIMMLRPAGAAPTRFHVGADGIALSPDGKWLYYCPLTSHRLYRVSADALADPQLSDSDVAKTVEDLGEKGGAADGLEADREGRIYITDFEHNAIRRRGIDGKIETLIHDPRILWPDTLSLASDGFLYCTANQMQRQAAFHEGRDLRQKPYLLFRVKVDGTRIKQ